jgi:hypothetical protein
MSQPPPDSSPTAEDYADIEQARRLVDKVNTRLAERGTSLMFAVTSHPAGGHQYPAGWTEIHEAG